MNINVPIVSQYHFVVRKDLSTATSSKIRHVVAEQILSFRRSKTTGNMSAIYMTFVPTPWYFDRHKGNLAESFCSEENYGNFSGYILYHSPIYFHLCIIANFKDGKLLSKGTFNSSSKTFEQSVYKITGNDVFLRRSAFHTKSSTEDDDIIDGGELDGVTVVGDAPDDDADDNYDDYYSGDWGYGDTPYGDDSDNNNSGEDYSGGGGGGGNSTTSPSMYGKGSKLSGSQIGLLSSAIKTLQNSYPAYASLLSYINIHGMKFKFVIDPSIAANGAYAAFVPGDNSIRFRSASCITSEKLREELIHAVQYQNYGSKMTNNVRNYEYEAKVFQDLACVFANGCCPKIGAINLDKSYK
jgi:hypothetical protein